MVRRSRSACSPGSTSVCRGRDGSVSRSHRYAAPQHARPLRVGAIDLLHRQLAMSLAVRGHHRAEPGLDVDVIDRLPLVTYEGRDAPVEFFVDAERADAREVEVHDA